jgi:hypothetical protein
MRESEDIVAISLLRIYIQSSFGRIARVLTYSGTSIMVDVKKYIENFKINGYISTQNIMK